MKIILADHYGLCFGVRDAIAQAEQLAAAEPLTILGELVHNPLVRERLAQAGAHEGELQRPGSAETPRVMITAHGASDARRAEWRAAGYDVADGTCPLVRQAHDRLRELVKAGYFPVVIGKTGHVEVQGLVGDFPESAVVLAEEDVEHLPRDRKLGIIAQTTQPIERVRSLVALIRRARPTSEVRFVDTVCQPTKNRQAAMRKLIEACDTIVVIGGRNSNNTLQLIAAGEAAGRLVFHIERPEELEASSFVASRVVGLTAGTSTLKETVAAAHLRLEAIARELNGSTQPVLAK